MYDMRSVNPFTRKIKSAIMLMATTIYSTQPLVAYANPAPEQLPTGGQIVAGQANISQNGANMNINQITDRAAINWQSFDIGSGAHVNFDQPSSNSVALNRVLNGNPSQIFGRLTANGKVYITNGAGVYFAPGSSANVGALVATTHDINNADFMDGKENFSRNSATGKVINEGAITVDLGQYVALLAPEVINDGIIIAKAGTIAMAAGESFELQFNGQGGLTDVKVTASDLKMLVENKQAVEAPAGLIILSAQAVNRLHGGVVKNSGTIEASGLVNDGGTVRLMASDAIELGGEIKADAKADSNGKGGTILAIATLDNVESKMEYSGQLSARGGNLGGDGGFIETSGSNVKITETAKVDTTAPKGKTGKWLVDPYDYDIDGAAATAIGNALNTTNVEVTTSANNGSYGSNGDNNSTGNITVNSAINSSSQNELTLTAANSILVNQAISTGSLVLNGPGGITLSNDLSTINGMTINGNITLGANVTLTSGVSETINTYSTYTVPNGVTLITATLVGATGGNGGDDGSNQGGSAGSAGSLTASFAVSGGDDIFVAPGSAGTDGLDSVGNGAGGAGGTNHFNLGNGGQGGNTGPTGTSGSGGGGGAATVLSLVNNPTGSSALLIAAGGGGGGGSGNNTACPSLCADQSSANYRNDSNMNGQAGFNAGNQGSSIQDGGGSGGGGGGLVGGISNNSVFFVNEWTGRGGNVGSSGAANDFTTTSISASTVNRGSGQDGYAILSYGGGTIDINGTINGGHSLNIVARSSDVDISGSIGGNSALTALNITGAQGINLSGGSVTTSGAQSYTGPVTLNSNNNVFTTTNSAVTFAGTVLKASGMTSNINISSGSGDVSFNGQVGTNGTPIGAMAISTTGNTNFGSAVYATSLAKTGSGKTNISGGRIQTTAGQSYAGIVDLGGNTTLSSTGTGDITLSGAVSNSNQSNLTINAAGGNVTLSGNLSVGTNARPTPIGDVSITASGAVNIGSSGTPVSIDAKSLSITADSANIYAASSSFTCGTGSSSTGICLTTSALMSIANNSTFSGPLTGTTSFTKSGNGNLTMTGNNTYSGNTTVNAGRLEISGTGRLGNGNYGGNVVVNGHIRFANSVNQDLTGTVSGTGYITSPGSGTLRITTQSNADHYNLTTVYVVPKSNSGTSSVYGDSPTFTYQLQTAAGGGTVVTDADVSGTAVISGMPNSSSAAGNYTISYVSGITTGNEMYVLQKGNDLSWTVTPRVITINVSKMFDGTSIFNKGFSISGIASGDTAPTITGTASVAGTSAGIYNSFASNNLVLSGSNYTLTGAIINATITPKPPVTSEVTTKLPDTTTIIPKPDNKLSDVTLPDYSYNSGSSSNQTVQNTNSSSTSSVSDNAQSNNANNSANSTTTNSPSSTSSSSSSAASSLVRVSGSGGAGTTYKTESGIVIALVQEPSTQASGVISVMIPKAVAEKGSGFTFPLPEQAAFQKGSDMVPLSAKMENGKPLPEWIKFNPEKGTFVAQDVPADGLPLRVTISNGDIQSTILIAENQ